MKRCHPNLYGLEVDLCSILQKCLYALDAFPLSLRRLASEGFSSEIALVADEEEWGATVVILGIDVERNSVLLPSVDNPLEASRVAMECRLVNREVFFFITSVENLILTAILFGIGENSIEATWVLVDTV